MFVDCDLLYLSDINELVKLIDDKYAAIMYRPYILGRTGRPWFCTSAGIQRTES